MAFPPLVIDEAVPGDSDIVSQFPAAERTFRNDLEDFVLTEHDTYGHHKIPRGSTATRDATSTWGVGSIFANTTTGTLQIVTATGPITWSEIFTALPDNIVATADIQDAAITAVKIADSIITFAKLASAAIADQTAAEAGTSSTTLLTPQRGTQLVNKHQAAAKAWASVAGASGAIQDSYGVISSVTRTSAGAYTVNLSAQPNANYAVQISIAGQAYAQWQFKTTTSFQVRTFNALTDNLEDYNFDVAVFGD